MEFFYKDQRKGLHQVLGLNELQNLLDNQYLQISQHILKKYLFAQDLNEI